MGLGLLYVSVMPWRAPGLGPVAATEGALLLLLILAFSPLSFNYFYVWLLYPLTVALYFGLEAAPRSRERWVMLGAVVGALGLLGLSLASSRVAAGYGNSLGAAALLFAALAGKLACDPAVASPWRWIRGRVSRGSNRATASLSAIIPNPPRPHRLPNDIRVPSGLTETVGSAGSFPFAQLVIPDDSRRSLTRFGQLLAP